MIRFGILGTARIARALFRSSPEGVQIAAIASRDVARANAFGDEFDIPLRFGSYEELLSHPSVDAVYIPLPPHLHCDYIVKAAEAGKHILAEKPPVMNSREMERVIAGLERHGVRYMEGLMYRFMKVHRRAREIVDEGTIGELRYIDFNFCFDLVTRGRTGFRNRKEEGGGALYDLGIYAVDFIRSMTAAEPRLLRSLTLREQEDGIDILTHAVYEAGKTLCSFTCGFHTDANYYVLSGQKGSVSNPVAISGRSLPNILRVHLLEGDTKYDEEFPAEDPYKTEIEYFARCIQTGENPVPDQSNSLANMKLIDQLMNVSEPIGLTLNV